MFDEVLDKDLQFKLYSLNLWLFFKRANKFHSYKNNTAP